MKKWNQGNDTDVVKVFSNRQTKSDAVLISLIQEDEAEHFSYLICVWDAASGCESSDNLVLCDSRRIFPFKFPATCKSIWIWWNRICYVHKRSNFNSLKMKLFGRLRVSLRKIYQICHFYLCAFEVTIQSGVYTQTLEFEPRVQWDHKESLQTH